MKSVLIAAVLVATSFAASADHHDYSPEAAAHGPVKTRAEVIAELHVAKAAGLMDFGDSEMRQTDRLNLQTPSNLTREQVKQEVVALRQQGRFEIQGDHR